MTKTEALRKGLLADGYLPVVIARTGVTAYTKRLPYKDSPDTYQVWCWVGGGATLRISRDNCITHAQATPNRAARLIKLGFGIAKPSGDELLAELAS